MPEFLAEYAKVLSSLTADNLHTLEPLLADEVEFRDPFNHSFGRKAFIDLLRDMFERLDDVSFQVDAVAVEGDVGMLHWTFTANSSLTGKICFQGMSRVCIDGNTQVISHYDYWDGSLVLELVPVLGKLISWLKRRFRH